MNRTIALTTTTSLAAALVLLGSGAVDLQAAKPPATLQVSTTIDAADSVGHPYLILGDGNAYVTTSDGLVSSTVSGGEWMLNTYALATSKGKLVIKRSGRTAFFQFSEPKDPNSQPPADLTGMVQAQVHMFSNCDSALATMSPGSFQDCAGAFRLEPINDNDTGYRLAFQPENYAEVTRMRVTCSAGSSGNCAAWTISPGASADGTSYTGSVDGLPRSLNQLLLLMGTTENVAQALGDYYFSFNIRVSR